MSYSGHSLREKSYPSAEKQPVWLFGFYGISTFVGYLIPNPFLYKFSVLFQTIQFSIGLDFVYSLLNVKTFLYKKSVKHKYAI